MNAVVHFGHDIIHGSQSEIIVVISSLSRKNRLQRACTESFRNLFAIHIHDRKIDTIVSNHENEQTQYFGVPVSQFIPLVKQHVH